ncbi:MAG TPA: hypothetical protein VMU57_01300 [Edaphobacter sp.]|nr:hypothetical protein [Edaphobacter sp.]
MTNNTIPAGASYYAFNGNANDQSGNGNNITLTGTTYGTITTIPSRTAAGGRTAAGNRTAV